MDIKRTFPLDLIHAAGHENVRLLPFGPLHKRPLARYCAHFGRFNSAAGGFGFLSARRNFRRLRDVDDLRVGLLLRHDVQLGLAVLHHRRNHGADAEVRRGLELAHRRRHHHLGRSGVDRGKAEFAIDVADEGQREHGVLL